jgi:drug/metabolite transporter (DMT)-like permease
MVIVMARGWLGTRIRMGAVAAAIAGVFGVALLLLGPDAALDPVGIAAGLGGAASMAAGTVLEPQVAAAGLRAQFHRVATDSGRPAARACGAAVRIRRCLN